MMKAASKKLFRPHDFSYVTVMAIAISIMVICLAPIVFSMFYTSHFRTFKNKMTVTAEINAGNVTAEEDGKVYKLSQTAEDDLIFNLYMGRVGKEQDPESIPQEGKRFTVHYGEDASLEICSTVVQDNGKSFGGVWVCYRDYKSGYTYCYDTPSLNYRTLNSKNGWEALEEETT